MTHAHKSSLATKALKCSNHPFKIPESVLNTESPTWSLSIQLDDRPLCLLINLWNRVTFSDRAPRISCRISNLCFAHSTLHARLNRLDASFISTSRGSVISCGRPRSFHSRNEAFFWVRAVEISGVHIRSLDLLNLWTFVGAGISADISRIWLNLTTVLWRLPIELVESRYCRIPWATEATYKSLSTLSHFTFRIFTLSSSFDTDLLIAINLNHPAFQWTMIRVYLFSMSSFNSSRFDTWGTSVFE